MVCRCKSKFFIDYIVNVSLLKLSERVKCMGGRGLPQLGKNVLSFDHEYCVTLEGLVANILGSVFSSSVDNFRQEVSDFFPPPPPSPYGVNAFQYFITLRHLHRSKLGSESTLVKSNLFTI